MLIFWGLFLLCSYAVSAYESPTVHEDVFLIRPSKKCSLNVSLSEYVLERKLLQFDSFFLLQAAISSGVGYYQYLRYPFTSAIITHEKTPLPMTDLAILQRRDQLLAVLTLKFYQDRKDESYQDKISHKIYPVTLSFDPVKLVDVIDSRLLPKNALHDFAKQLPCLDVDPEDVEQIFSPVLVLPDDPLIDSTENFPFGQWYLGGPYVDRMMFDFGANVLQAWADYRGEAHAVDIAVLSPGCSIHPDLQYNYVRHLTDSQAASIREPLNSYWGTPVAGMIAATTNNNYGGAGICWSCKLYCFQVYDDDNVLNRKAIVAAFEAIERNNIKVVYLGYTSFEYSIEEALALERLAAKNILVVAPAGNQDCDVEAQYPSSEYGCRDQFDNPVEGVYPALYGLKNLLTVGSSELFGGKATFSNWGFHAVDLMAPGVDLLLPASIQHSNPLEQYAHFSGTEFSAALVTGIAALMYSKNPNLTPEEVIEILVSTSQPAKGLQSLCRAQGIVDANAALKEVEALHTEQPEPQHYPFPDFELAFGQLETVLLSSSARTQSTLFNIVFVGFLLWFSVI